MSDNIYDNGMYTIRTVDFRDPIIEELVTGYGVFNNGTGVREYEARRLYYAMSIADRFKEEMVQRDVDNAAIAAAGPVGDVVLQ